MTARFCVACGTIGKWEDTLRGWVWAPKCDCAETLADAEHPVFGVHCERAPRDGKLTYWAEADLVVGFTAAADSLSRLRQHLQECAPLEGWKTWRMERADCDDCCWPTEALGQAEALV